MKTKELEKLSLPQLADKYNEHTDGRKIKKFRDRGTALRRTAQAIAAYKAREGTAEAVKNMEPQRLKAHKPFNYEPLREIKQHRPNTARAKAVKALLKGATFAEVQQATGWEKYHQCYEGIKLIHTQLGHGLRQNSKGVIFIDDTSAN